MGCSAIGEHYVSDCAHMNVQYELSRQNSREYLCVMGRPILTIEALEGCVSSPSSTPLPPHTLDFQSIGYRRF
jgi:hypothetical protein